MWVFDPDAGGVKIPERTKRDVETRLKEYAAKHYADDYAKIEIKFRGAFCYIDVFTNPPVSHKMPVDKTQAEMLDRLRNTPTHLCRLRHFTVDRWTCGFYLYSSNKYELFTMGDGSFDCTPEEGFEMAASVQLDRPNSRGAF